MPTPRNFRQEIGDIPALGNQLIGANYDNLLQFQGAYTGLNTGNYGRALLGEGADTSGGAAALARAGFNAANPELVAYNQDFRGTLDRLNGAPALRMDPLGYAATEAAAPTLGRAPQTRVATASTSRVGQSVLAPNLTADALNYGQVSPLQLEMQRQAYEDLTAGGPTSGELAAATDSARAAYSDRGMLRSNRGVGAEILATDELRRARRNEARNFASAVDQQGFTQRQGNRSFALQAGEFLQAPDYFNAAATNDTSRFNATARNTVGMNNTALRGQYGLTEYGTRADLNRFNATANNEAQRFNATAVNDASRFNTGLAYQQQADQWGRSLDYGNFLRGQTLDPSSLASSLAGGTPDYTGALLNYGSDVNNTNFNAAAAAENTRANNKAATTSSAIGGVATIAAAKLFFMCIPEGQRIDTPGGGVAIENLKPGMRVIGFDGEPVLVQMAHAYLEEPQAKRFLRFELEDGEALNVCDMHRLHGLRAKTYNVGDRLGGVRIKSITPFGGVRRSYDLLTSDRGYRIAGVPVNSMIQEMARSIAA